MVREFKTGKWVLFASVSTFIIVVTISTLSAAISAALAGALWWWVIIERPLKLAWRRGVKFGILTVLLAHFLHPIVAIVLNLPMIGGGVPAGAQFTGLLPSIAELRLLTYSLMSWYQLSLLATILTGPIGIVAGLVLVAIRRRFPSESEVDTQSNNGV